METLRALLLGGPVAHQATLALAWCLGIAMLSYLWSRSLFNRRASH